MHDCGMYIYICLYPYNMYLMCNHTFTNLGIDKKLILISHSAEFKFTYDGISQIRIQLDELGQFMSITYK